MTGQPATLSHGEIQRIIDDIAETNRCKYESMALRITENAEIQTTSDSEETAIQINLSSSFTNNSQYFLSRVSSSSQNNWLSLESEHGTLGRSH